MDVTALQEVVKLGQPMHTRQAVQRFVAGITPSTPVSSFLSAILLDSEIVSESVADRVSRGALCGDVDADRALEHSLRISASAAAASPTATSSIAHVVASCTFAIALSARRPSPPTLHPLSTLLSSCPASWEPLFLRWLPDLVGFVSSKTPADCSAASEWLWPFLRATLIATDPANQLLRIRCHSFAVSAASKLNSRSLSSRIVSLFPFYDAFSPHGIDLAISAARDISASLLVAFPAVAPQFFDSVLSFCASAVSSDHRPSLSPLISVLCDHAKSFDACSHPSAFSFLAHCLRTGADSEQKLTLELIESFLNRGPPVCTFSAAVLCGSLVEVQCSASDESNSRVAGRISSELMKKFLSAADRVHQQQQGHSSCKDGAPMNAPRSPFLVLVESMKRDVCSTWRGTESEIVAWAGSVAREITESHVTALFVLLSRAFLHSPSAAVKLAALDIVSAAASLNPVQAFAFLPSMLGLLSGAQQENPDVVSKTLLTLPKLTSNKANVPTLLRVVLPLLKHQAMFPTALRTLFLFWTHQPRTFMFLHEQVQRYSSTAPLETRLAIAMTIRDVCTTDLDRGAEFANVVARVLEEDQNRAVLGLAIDSLERLCEAKAIDFQSAWAAVEKKHGASDDPVIASSVASLLGCCHWKAMKIAGKKVEEDRTAPKGPDRDETFVNDIAAKLWKLSESPNVRVRTAAYGSLAKFPVQFIEPVFDGAAVSRLCSEADKEAREKATAFVSKMCSEETGFRGAAVQQSSQASSQAQKALAGIAGLIREQNSSEAHVGTARSALSGAMLWAFAPPADGDAATKEETYWRALEELIMSIEGADWTTRVLALSGFVAFMRRLVADLVVSAKGSEAASVAAVVGRAVKVFNEQRTESPARAEMCAIAAGALALCLPQSARAGAMEVSETIRRWIAEGAEAQFLSGCRVGLACAESAVGVDRSGPIAALVDECARLVSTGEDWERFGCSIGLAVIACKVAEFAAAAHKDSPTAQALVGVQAQLLGVLKTNPPEWWCWGTCVALSSVTVALFQCGIAGSLDRAIECLSGEAKKLTKTKEPSNAREAVSLAALAPMAVVAFKAGKLAAAACSDLIHDLLEVANCEDAAASLRSGCLVAIGSLLNGLVSCGFQWTTFAPAKQAVDTISSMAADEGLSSNLAFGTLFAAANLIGSDSVITSAASPAPFPDAVLGSGATVDAKFDEATPKLVGSLKTCFCSDRVGVWKAAAWALGTLCRPLPQNRTLAAGRVDAAFEGMATIKATYDLLESCVDPVIAESPLACLSAASRLPTIPWALVVQRVAKAGLGDGVTKSCIGFAKSRFELALKASGAAARTVATGCIPMLCAWLDPPAMLSASCACQEAAVAALDSLAGYSFADYHRCAALLLAPHAALSLNRGALLSLLGSVCTRVGAIKEIPDGMLMELEGIAFELFRRVPSHVSFASGSSVPKVDAAALSLVETVAGCMFAISTRRRTVDSSISLLTAPLEQASTDAETCARNIFAMAHLGITKVLAPCRRWCASTDPRSGRRHAAAILCGMRLAHAAGDQSSWLLDAVDTLASPQCLSTLAVAAMMEQQGGTALCTASHSRRLLVAAAAGRCADPSLNGFLPLQISRVVSGKGGSKLLDRIESIISATGGACPWNVPQTQLLLLALPGHHFY